MRQSLISTVNASVNWCQRDLLKAEAMGLLGVQGAFPGCQATTGYPGGKLSATPHFLFWCCPGAM
jgi:hypothetical protein